MSIRSPRRIFRRSTSPARSRLAWALLAVPVGMAAAGAVALSMRPGLPSVPRAAPSGLTMTADASQVAVVDGDTLRLRDTVIRLRGVAAPPRGTGCGPVAGRAIAARQSRARWGIAAAGPA